MKMTELLDKKKVLKLEISHRDSPYNVLPNSKKLFQYKKKIVINICFNLHTSYLTYGDTLKELSK